MFEAGEIFFAIMWAMATNPLAVFWNDVFLKNNYLVYTNPFTSQYCENNFTKKREDKLDNDLKFRVISFCSHIQMWTRSCSRLHLSLDSRILPNRSRSTKTQVY